MTMEERFQQIACELPDAKIGNMFGSKCIKAPNGKAAAIFWNDQMVFKLDEADARLALDLPGAQVFNPMGTRPMSGWVQVPAEFEEHWQEYAQNALSFVSTLPAKSRKR